MCFKLQKIGPAESTIPKVWKHFCEGNRNWAMNEGTLFLDIIHQNRGEKRKIKYEKDDDNTYNNSMPVNFIHKIKLLLCVPSHSNKYPVASTRHKLLLTKSKLHLK